jgi:hypothetical protein
MKHGISQEEQNFRLPEWFFLEMTRKMRNFGK